jgi:CRP-like cAMP-binding protein
MATGSSPQNHLLGRLPSHSAFRSSLERTKLEIRQELEIPGDPVPYVYFPQTGLASVIATSGAAKKIEVGMIGHEGMTGSALVLGADRAAHLVLVQSPGWALRLPREAFLASLEAPDLRALWLRYVHVLMVQTSQTALANGTATLIQRLARWILMWHDRVRDSAFTVTHDYIALLLGVRRAGVTVALHHLEGDRLIRSKRNQVTVLDRDGLAGVAKGFYGASEAEYRRVIG